MPCLFDGILVNWSTFAVLFSLVLGIVCNWKYLKKNSSYKICYGIIMVYKFEVPNRFKSFSVDQIVAITVYFLLTIAYYAFFAPFVAKDLVFEYVAIGGYTFLVRFHPFSFACYVKIN